MNENCEKHLEALVEGIGDLKVQQATILEKQSSVHDKLVGISERLDVLNGRVYGLEQGKADRAEVQRLNDRVVKIMLWIAGSGGVAFGAKELFF